LTAVIDPNAPSNGVAVYNYDEVGNITSIERLSSSGVSVVQVSPAQGYVGQEVVIYGTGFSSTPASNTVTFSGSAGATVTEATETQLHVTVPSGATTGAISVTAPGGSDTSDSFTVVAAPEEPSISSLSASLADPGTTITVSGSDFGSTVAKNIVSVGQVRGTVATASSSSLTFPVPAGATSGRVLVATPDGSTTSSSDLFVPPSGFTASQVDATDRMTIGETNNVITVSNSSKVGLVVFDAEAGDSVFVRIPSMAISVANIRLYDPFGVELAWSAVASSGGYLDTQRLPTTGTYSILVDPITGSGNATLSLYAADPSTGTITANGTAHTISGLTIGQNALRTFTADEDDRVFLKVESQMTATTRLRHPGGWVIASVTSLSSGPAYIDTKTLDADGEYTLEVDPSGTGTGNVTLTLHDVAADTTGTITVGGSAVTVTNTSPGQNGTRTFSGTADQRISLNLTSVSVGSSGTCRLKVYVYKPDASTLTSNTCVGSAGAFIDVQTLPTTGTYTVLVDPVDDKTGSVTLTLYDVAADSTGTITAGGSAVTVTNTSPGQNGTRTFSGAADQRISLNLTSVSVGSSGTCRLKVYIYKPDASTLASNTCVSTAGAFIDTQTLPSTGTYSILVDPIDDKTGSVTLTLYDVPADDTGSMSINGGSVTTTLSTPGQNGTRTFSGTSSQAVTLTISSVSIGSSSCCSAKVSIKRPNGTNLVTPTSFGTSGKTINTTLDATGTHTILIDPQDAATGSATLALTSGASFQATAEPEALLAAVTQTIPAARRPKAPSPDPDGRDHPERTPETRSAQPRESLADSSYVPGTIEEWFPTSGEAATWFSGRSESPYESLPSLAADPGVTALAGQVLRLDGLPLPGVLVSSEDARALTDRDGRFLLEGLPAGRSVITVDARTANRRGATYGIYEMGIELKKGTTTELPYTIWSPKLDTTHEIQLDYPLEEDVVLTNPLIPGLEVHIPAGSEIHDRQGNLVRRLGITPLPLDRSPFPMPGRFPVYFTIQPGAAYVWPHGVEIVYPNKMHARPGERVEFYSYDPLEKDWYVYGKGSVTPDGKQIRFDPGTRQYELTSSGICLGCAYVLGGLLLGFLADGDPVDLASGVFTYAHADLLERGTPTIDVSRLYRSNDTQARMFGTGTTSVYSMALYQPTTHDYSSADLILADGRRIPFTRTSPGTGYTDMVLEAREAPGSFFASRIAWNGRAWELRLVDGTVYTFGNGGLLESIRDRFGNQTTITHSNGVIGDITRVHSSSGRWLAYTYSSGRVSEVEDQSGRSVTYGYTSGRLTQVTDARGEVTEYTYDGQGRLESIEDGRDIVWLTNDYDGNGRVETQTLADEGTYEFDYTLDGSGNVTQTDVTDPRGFVRRVTFDADGYPLSDTLAQGTARAQTTTYEYESGTHLLLAATDERDRRTEYAYNDAGRLTQITELADTGDAVSTDFAYEPEFQQLAEVTDPLGHGPSFDYDARGALVTITDARNEEWTLVPNIAGQPVSFTNPLENETTFEYTLGEVIAVTDPDDGTYGLFNDSAGRLVSVTDPLGGASRFGYDAADGLISITDPAGEQATLERDENGNITSVTDAKLQETHFTYDSMDRVATREDPLEEVESYEYDDNGNLIELTDREGQVTTLAYDELNRLTFAGFGTTGPPESPSYESTIELTYDNGNRLTEADDSEFGTITREYDELDRLAEEETPDGAVAYSYDDASRRETMTVEGEIEVEYDYDNADRLTSVTRGAVSAVLAYDDASRLESLTLPNGIAQLYEYDPSSKLAAIIYEEDSSPIGELIYGYDPVGLQTSMGGSYARTDLPSAVASTDYDAGNRLTEWGAQSFTYDDNGNMTGDGTKAYTWNARDQLASLSGGGTTASFEYDPFGRRTAFTLNSNEIRYLHDRRNVVQELVSGTPTADLLSGLGIDELVAVIESGGPLNALTDPLGSTIALADDTGAIEAEYTYEPFGKATQSGTESVPYQYTGRENDQTGLQYNRARYYRPELGRFISEDPLGFAGGDVNLYAYAFNSPLAFRDPTGNAGVLIPILIGAAGGGVGAAVQGEGLQGIAHATVLGGIEGLAFGYGVNSWKLLRNPYIRAGFAGLLGGTSNLTGQLIGCGLSSRKSECNVNWGSVGASVIASAGAEGAASAGLSLTRRLGHEGASVDVAWAVSGAAMAVSGSIWLGDLVDPYLP
jgi:RHS repeat-associated protein